MFERFTVDVKAAIAAARRDAAARNNDEVDAAALAAAFFAAWRGTISPPLRWSERRRLPPLSESARRALADADSLAVAGPGRSITVAHVLLCLLNGPSAGEAVNGLPANQDCDALRSDLEAAVPTP